MNPADLAQILEMLATALRAMPATPGAQPAAPVAVPGRTLGDWLDIHVAQVLARGYKAQTVRNRTANLRHVRRLWGDRPIDALKPHEIITRIRAEFVPHQLSTAQRVLSELREAYNEAIANDWTQNNPASAVKVPSQRVKRKRLPIETWQAMRALSRASGQPWLESLLLLALVTGQRRGDLVKMRFDDVHDGHLHVVQQKEAGKGFGARVAIPLSLRMEAIGMTVGEVIEHCRGVGEPGPTMLRKANGAALDESSLSVRFADCIRAVCGPNAYGKEEWPSLHEVRSLTARTYIAQGMDIKTVQVLLGHKHAEMTQLYEDDRGLTAKEFKRVEIE